MDGWVIGVYVHVYECACVNVCLNVCTYVYMCSFIYKRLKEARSCSRATIRLSMSCAWFGLLRPSAFHGRAACGVCYSTAAEEVEE